MEIPWATFDGEKGMQIMQNMMASALKAYS